MLHDSIYKNRDTTQRLVCQYEQFRQNVRLKKGMSRWFYFIDINSTPHYIVILHALH